MTLIMKLETEEEAIETLSTKIADIASEAITNRSKFRIGLSGGSLIKYLVEGLPKIETDWSKWELFFCDERFVGETDADSTFGVYKRELLPKLEQLKEDQFVVINTEISLDECAIDYENKIKRSFNIDDGDTTIPQFDLLLLGMGPDGHTCSLFPSHPLLKEVNKLVAPISDSPKPPLERVTMTLPLVNRSKNIIFTIIGPGKSELIKKIIIDKETLVPAGLVKPSHGTLIWIVDDVAASHLNLS